jgi:hypothetical protein
MRTIPRGRRRMAIRRVAMVLSWVALPVAAAAGDTTGTEHDYAFGLYGGSQTDRNWHESLFGQADFVNAHLVVAALSRTLRRAGDRSSSVRRWVDGPPCFACTIARLPTAFLVKKAEAMR